MGQVKGGVRMNTVIVNGINITEENERLKIELNELKRDVARYFELEKRLHYIGENANTIYEIENMKRTYRETLKELYMLEEKLSKVGKAE